MSLFDMIENPVKSIEQMATQPLQAGLAFGTQSMEELRSILPGMGGTNGESMLPMSGVMNFSNPFAGFSGAGGIGDISDIIGGGSSQNGMQMPFDNFSLDGGIGQLPNSGQPQIGDGSGFSLTDPLAGDLSLMGPTPPGFTDVNLDLPTPTGGDLSLSLPIFDPFNLGGGNDSSSPI